MTITELFKLLDIWKNRLGLSHWKIFLIVDVCEDETSYMEVERSIDYPRARITVSPWMLGEGFPPKENILEINDVMIEETLVHELLHLCTRDLVGVIRNDLYGQVHRDVYQMFDTAIRHADERCVDALAVALCQAFREEKPGSYLDRITD